LQALWARIALEGKSGKEGQGGAMSWLPDAINGTFELMSGFFLWNNVRILIVQKAIRGVSILTTAVFTIWGFWNLFYYPHLGQWLSFFGGINVVMANTVWVSLAIKYRKIVSRKVTEGR
jgi:hypothetical protein